MTTKRIIFIADVPDDVDEDDLKAFVVEWMENGGGCRHPEDTLFSSLGDVKVQSVSNARRSSRT